MKIDTSKFIKHFNALRKLRKVEEVQPIKKEGIKTTKEYFKLCGRNNTVPIMPGEFYKGYTNLAHEFTPKTKNLFL